MAKFDGTPDKKVIQETDAEYFNALDIGDKHTGGGTVLSKKNPNSVELCNSESRENCLRCKDAHVCPLYNARLRI